MRLATVFAMMLLAGCSLVLDHEDVQCETNDDCTRLGIAGVPVCTAGVCVATDLGPEGCFLGTPTTATELANACTVAQCEKFDDCERLGICDGVLPDAIMPPTVTPTTPPIVPFPTQLCVEDPATTIVVTGSSAVSNFLQAAAPILASAGFRIAYQPSGSCNGVDQIFNPDPSKLVAKDKNGTVSVLFPIDGSKGVPCTWGAGANVDVGVTDVFSTSCNPAYVPGTTIAEFVGPIQPMTFVVPATSDQTVISAAMGHVIFGRGSMDTRAEPFTDPDLYFVRNSSSGTQQMLSRAIGIEASTWWGKNAGGSGAVVTGLQSVAPALADKVIGILSTDALKTEDVRRNIRVLSYQGQNQICGFLPDRIPVSLDKINVRDGHYPIWGPVHFYTAVTSGVPSTKAGALVQRFSLPGIDQGLLDSITLGGLVPQCAMKVTRESEMGPIVPFEPAFQCGCYFESKLANDSVPDGCAQCESTNDCSSDKPACNLGFCEVR
jgi:hypothetical protein